MQLGNELVFQGKYQKDLYVYRNLIFRYRDISKYSMNTDHFH